MRKAIIVGFFTVCMLSIGVLGNIRPLERIALYRSPDEVHLHQVFKKHPLSQEFTATAQGLSAISITLRDDEEAKDTALSIQIKNVTDDFIVISKTITADDLQYVSFAPQRQSGGKRYSITLDAFESSQTQAIYIRYQSDTTADPGSIVMQDGTQKQGSLGLREYEKPTIALMVWRWLLLPHQRPLWIGIGILIVGIYLQKGIHTTNPHEGGGRGDFLIKYSKLLHYALIFLSVLIVYWPATHLFFYSDDVPILARVATLEQENPLLLTTPHRPVDPDPRSAFGFDFYRPISFSLYPLLLHTVFPPNAALYYFFNIVLFATIACCLWSIAHLVSQSKSTALLAVSLWAMHTSKLGLVYWWSSVQDLLASLFSMLSFLLYFRWRNTSTKKPLYLSVAFFCLALFSKEYIVVTPFILALVDYLFFTPIKNMRQAGGIVRRLSPFIISIGMFLIVNTAILGDPMLPQAKHTDQTYLLTATPTAIARNAIIYLSASAENRIWPVRRIFTDGEEKLSMALGLWEAKTAGPYYPGVIITALVLMFLVIFWKNTHIRNICVLGIVWWLAYLGPILLFANDWKVRWLTLSLFGLSLILASLLRTLIGNRAIIYGLSFILALYGYSIARDPALTRFYREQSAYTRQAYHQLREQEQYTQEERRIILVGIVPDQQTSLNAYLFRIYAKNPKADIIYADAPPQTPLPGDIIINMSGITPYYPESEK